MDRDRKSGIWCIVVGLLIPLAVLPFVTGFSKEKGFLDNLYKPGIQLKADAKGGAERGSGAGPAKGGFFWRLIPRSIPFRFFLVPTAILLYVGIIRIDRARRRAKGEVVDPPPIDDDGQRPEAPQQPR